MLTSTGAPPQRAEEFPRPLSPNERAALLWLLNVRDFPGRDGLLAQVDATVASARCACGCASVDLEVDPAVASAPAGPSPIPNSAHVHDASGEIVGGLLVFLTEGRLSLLEIYKYGDDPITEMPPTSRLSTYDVKPRSQSDASPIRPTRPAGGQDAESR